MVGVGVEVEVDGIRRKRVTMAKPEKEETIEVLRRAAELIDNRTEDFGCDAIFAARIYWGAAEQAQKVLYEWLQPLSGDNLSYPGFWHRTDRQSRIIGLLLAAEIEETS